jgi:hypothetical protein
VALHGNPSCGNFVSWLDGEFALKAQTILKFRICVMMTSPRFGGSVTFFYPHKFTSQFGFIPVGQVKPMVGEFK